MYESPVKIFETQMHMECENGICKAIVNQGVDVNKEELLKALNYDREQYKKGYQDARLKFAKTEPCYMCDNARLNYELTDENDFSSCTIGSYSTDCRIMLSSGHGKPLRVEVERWNEYIQEWEIIGRYYPKYCPECGREINEYMSNKHNYF